MKKLFKTRLIKWHLTHAAVIEAMSNTIDPQHELYMLQNTQD